MPHIVNSRRKGKLGKTAQFWTGYGIYSDFCATKLNDLHLHMLCIKELCPLPFSMDHHNYARYLTVYFLQLLNLQHSHPGADDLLKNNGLSVSRSSVAASRNAVDLTIEQTVNRHAKLSGGIVGFSRNLPAYYRWCITRHSRPSYVTAALQLVGMSSTDECSHKDVRKSEIKQSDVQKIIQSFQNFINPFGIEESEASFVCLSSGVRAPDSIETYVLNVDTEGAKAFEEFIKTRFVDTFLIFHEPVERQSFKTFNNLKQSKHVISSQKKVIEVAAQRNFFGQLLMLSEENNLNVEKVLSYPLGPVPWSLATSDGMPVKTEKAKLLHKLEDETALFEPQQPEILPNTVKVCVVDGNALLQAITRLPNIFGELAQHVFSSLPKVKRVDFVTDSYKEQSIKSFERSRHGPSQTFLVKGSSTKLPRDWKSFLSNSDNKKNLIRLLLSEWSSDGTTTESRCVPELSSSQEEADTRIILHCFHAAASASCHAICNILWVLYLYNIRNLEGELNKMATFYFDCLQTVTERITSKT